MDPQADPALRHRWSPWHDRLHRELLRHPHWLPRGEPLLLALSGGQDSMALTALLLGLQRLHHWDLHLWHGDHSWHGQSAAIAQELQTWCLQQGLALQISHAEQSSTQSEAAARQWRYSQLGQHAASLRQSPSQSPCRRVVCAHTATDKAETLLLQMVRGTDLAGLGSLRSERPLGEPHPPTLLLMRPLLSFSRAETAAICDELKLPVWLDPSNTDLHFSRNRIRQEVMPVLESMHPGCERRMAQLSERLSHLHNSQMALLDLSLHSLQRDNGLDRRRLSALALDLRRSLLARWLQHQGAPVLSARQLDDLATAIAPHAAPSGRDLGQGWRLHWSKNALQLEQQ
jgi:tRNA(Ile)-lysidine synthase